MCIYVHVCVCSVCMYVYLGGHTQGCSENKSDVYPFNTHWKSLPLILQRSWKNSSRKKMLMKQSVIMIWKKNLLTSCPVLTHWPQVPWTEIAAVPMLLPSTEKTWTWAFSMQIKMLSLLHHHEKHSGGSVERNAIWRSDLQRNEVLFLDVNLSEVFLKKYALTLVTSQLCFKNVSSFTNLILLEDKIISDLEILVLFCRIFFSSFCKNHISLLLIFELLWLIMTSYVT